MMGFLTRKRIKILMKCDFKKNYIDKDIILYFHKKKIAYFNKRASDTDSDTVLFLVNIIYPKLIRHFFNTLKTFVHIIIILFFFWISVKKCLQYVELDMARY